MVDVLLRCHRHEQVLVEPFRQLRQHLILGPANQHWRQRLADSIKIAIANDLAVVITHLMIGQESERWPEPMPIDEPDN